ncbi:MAG TPA: queuosine precursor transporter [Desulfobacterales bacterium]|nr:queuosine precursor transporter [Desulfobacterales bacterium]
MKNGHGASPKRKLPAAGFPQRSSGSHGPRHMFFNSGVFAMGNHRFLPLVAAVFVTSLLVSNIIAIKLASFGTLPLAGSLFLPVAVIIFPISYIFGDVLTEVYGYARARQVIWIGFGCNLLAVLAIWVGGLLPAAPFWNATVYDSPAAAQQAYEAILGFTPRLLIASFIAYLAGEFLNSFVLAKLKIATAGKWLWLRTISSTLLGQLADSGLFISIAFAGIVPETTLGQLIVTQWLFKSAYEVIATPLTYVVVNFLKRTEQQDHYDRETNFNPWVIG